MMNKKGLQFKLAFFALIAMSLLIISTGIWISEWNEDYGSNLDNDLDEFNSLDSISSDAESQQDRVVVTSVKSGERFEDSSLRGVYGIINNIYEPFRVVFGDGGLIDAVTERFGFPDYVRQGLITAMVITITMTLIGIIFRRVRNTV